MLRQARQGALLREGIRVVIAGQPNAGKSSLLNALAGAELAIVTPIAGTTRDVVQQTIQIEGVPLHVIDTAGLREGEGVDAVEQIGIERAWGQIEQADAVLFLHDLTRADEAAYAAADADIARSLTQRVPAAVPVIDIWNKADAAQAADRDGFVLSAKTGDGLQALRQREVRFHVAARTEGEDAVFDVTLDANGTSGVHMEVKGEARVRLRDAKLASLSLA